MRLYYGKTYSVFEEGFKKTKNLEHNVVLLLVLCTLGKGKREGEMVLAALPCRMVNTNSQRTHQQQRPVLGQSPRGVPRPLAWCPQSSPPAGLALPSSGWPWDTGWADVPSNVIIRIIMVHNKHLLYHPRYFIMKNNIRIGYRYGGYIYIVWNTHTCMHAHAIVCVHACMGASVHVCARPIPCLAEFFVQSIFMYST